MSKEEVNWDIKQATNEGKLIVLSCRSDIKVYPNKDSYPWLLTINIEINGERDDGLTTQADAEILNDFEDTLGLNFEKLVDPIFVGRTTWNGWRDLYFYISEPLPVHAYLGQVIAIQEHPKNFEYRIEQDLKWEKVIEFFNAD